MCMCMDTRSSDVTPRDALASSVSGICNIARVIIHRMFFIASFLHGCHRVAYTIQYMRFTYSVPLFKEELSEIRAVLSSDTGDESYFVLAFFRHDVVF